MHELGELEAAYPEFEKRGVRLVVLSVDDQETTKRTQQKFPHLIVLADPEHKTTDAFQALHPGAGPGHTDIAAPTTWLLDATGTVRWAFRPDQVLVRLTPPELLAKVDEHLVKK